MNQISPNKLKEFWCGLTLKVPNFPSLIRVPPVKKKTKAPFFVRSMHWLRQSNSGFCCPCTSKGYKNIAVLLMNLKLLIPRMGREEYRCLKKLWLLETYTTGIITRRRQILQSLKLNIKKENAIDTTNFTIWGIQTNVVINVI